MPNDYFEFKKFKLWQDKCAMKVGTDGVLLGSWVQAAGELRILDIGTGTGLLALMLAQRTTGIIDAVELDKAAAEQAEVNFLDSEWSERINCFNQSFQEYAKKCQVKYDLILSNPPFFSSGERSVSGKRAMARHSDTLTLGQLLQNSNQMLHSFGRFALVLPYEQRGALLKEAIANGFWVLREVRIRPTPLQSFVRVLFEFARRMPEGYAIEEISIEHGSRHNYHDSFIACTQDYYLNPKIAVDLKE